MWTAWVLAATALGAVAFMLWFLVALLRESTPAVWYCVLLARPEPGEDSNKDQDHKAERRIYDENGCHMAERNRSEHYLEFLENDGHVEEEYASGLITLDVRPASASLRWRSIRNGLYVLRRHRLWCARSKRSSARSPTGNTQ
jgi:hypothetical protein